MYNNGYNGTPARQDESGAASILSNVMTGVYLYMFLGLLVTAAAAYLAYANGAFVLNLATDPALLYGLLIGELLLVMILSAAVHKLPFAAGAAMFVLYSALNGLTLSVIFLVYNESSIFSSFLVACLTFGAMSVIGYVTKKDLTAIGNYLFMGLIGLVIAGIVNLFIMKDLLSFLLSAVGLLIFIGLTAYDTQKIKIWLAGAADERQIQIISLRGALTLYLDFINIFLILLRLTGKRRR